METTVELVHVPKDLLIDVLKTALADSRCAEQDSAVTAEDHANFARDRDKIERLLKVAGISL